MSGYCEICGNYKSKLHEHHLICGINRGDSDEEGLTMMLCPECHTLGKYAIHSSHVAESLSKIAGQALWERQKMLEALGIFDSEFANHADEEIRMQFRQKFGRSFL